MITNNRVSADIEKCKSLEDLYEEMTSLRLRMAFQTEFDNLLQSIEDNDNSAHLVCDDDRVLRLIDKRIRRNQIRHFCHRVLPAVGKSIAMILLVFYIGLTTAAATVAPVRVALSEFIMNFGSEYVEIELRGTGEFIDVPVGWNGDYIPSLVPDGYAIKHVGEHTLVYNDPMGSTLTFQEYDNNSSIRIDMSSSSIEYTSVNGSHFVVVNREAFNTVYWSNGDHIFVLGGNMSKDGLLAIADSIRIIR